MDAIRNFLLSIPSVTRNILLICVITFLGSTLGELMGKGDLLTEYFALYYPASDSFHIWQPLTYLFLHGGLSHLFFNMWAFVLFGTALEKVLGSSRYLLLFLLSGLGAAALHIGVEYLSCQHALEQFIAQNPAFDPAYLTQYFQEHTLDQVCPPTVGASGAIYGIMLAFAMTWPNAELMFIFPPIPIKAKWMACIFVVIELLTGIFLTNDGVAHFAHLGGMLIAFILMLIWKRQGSIARYY